MHWKHWCMEVDRRDELGDRMCREASPWCLRATDALRWLDQTDYENATHTSKTSAIRV